MKYVLIAREDEVQASFLSRLLALHQRSRRAPTFNIVHARGKSRAELLELNASLIAITEEEASTFFVPAQVVANDAAPINAIDANQVSIDAIANDMRVVWLRNSATESVRETASEIQTRAIHATREAQINAPDWVHHVDLILDKKDIAVVSSDELVILMGLGDGPVAQLDGVITLHPEVFSNPKRCERWIQRHLALGLRWIELRSDLLNEEQLRMAAMQIPPQRRLWSVRQESHAALIRKLHEIFHGDVDWTLTPGSTGGCWVEPRFLSIRSREAGQSVSDVLKNFPRMMEEGTQLNAEFEIHSLEELVELENWRRVFAVARVTNPVSTSGRWRWFRLLRGIEHPLSYVSEKAGFDTHAGDQDRPDFLQWVRRRKLQNSERNRHGQLFFAAQIMQINDDHAAVPVISANSTLTPAEMSASHPHYHVEFFARFAAPLFEVKLTANELRKNGLQKLSRFGLRWAQLDANLALLEDGNTWVCDHATLNWRGKWIDVTPREDFIAKSVDLLGPNSKLKLKPVRAQHDFWNRAYDESED